MDHTAVLEAVKKGVIFLSFLGMEPRFVGCRAQGMLTMLIKQFQLILPYKTAGKAVVLSV